MSFGSGIAIAGIWGAVAYSTAYIGPGAVFLGIFAGLATVLIAIASAEGKNK